MVIPHIVSRQFRVKLLANVVHAVAPAPVWLFRDNREKLICMVNDIIGELLDLDMEPPEPLRTSAHKQEDMKTLRVGSRDRSWDLPFCEVFDVLGDTVIIGMGRDSRAPNAPCARV